MSNLEGLDVKQRLASKLLSSVPMLLKLPPTFIRRFAIVVEWLIGLPKITMKSITPLSIPLSTCNQSISARLYQPQISSGGALVYFHGGGCVIGGLDSHDRLIRYLANYSGINIIAVQYRLAPEAKFPIPINDAIDAWNWIVSNERYLNIGLSRLGVGGDSAGAYLAAIISMRKEQKKLAVQAVRLPDFQFLIYPMTDLRGSTKSYREFGSGLILSNKLMDYFVKHYLADPEQINDSLVSIVLSNEIASSPKTYVLTVEYDPLRDCGIKFVDELRAAKVDFTHEHLHDCMHAFPTVGRVSSRAREATVALALSLKEFVK
ncbi:MAG: acetyl esterase [Alteromonadaceae bacterium]|jgi:acetyl esterase